MVAAPLRLRSLRSIFGIPKEANNCHKVRVLCFTGATCTGKTTLANGLLKELERDGLRTRLVGQDQFYKPCNALRTVLNERDPSITFYDYDNIDALDETALSEAIRQEMSDPQLDILILEGNMLSELDSILNLVDAAIFLTIDKENCRQRRMLRVYDPPDEIGYFDQIVWPFYEQTLQKAKDFDTKKKRFVFLRSERNILLEEVIIAFEHLLCDKIVLCHNDALTADSALNWVSSPSCGANSLFTGTTRDTFDEKRVIRLEYEAYEPMAQAELTKLCLEVRTEIDRSIFRIFIGHRIGIVPIGKISVLIATSAPQRNAAILATKWLIDELKKRVPIWKKEVYDDGSCSWKENVDQPE